MSWQTTHWNLNPFLRLVALYFSLRFEENLSDTKRPDPDLAIERAKKFEAYILGPENEEDVKA